MSRRGRGVRAVVVAALVAVTVGLVGAGWSTVFSAAPAAAAVRTGAATQIATGGRSGCDPLLATTGRCQDLDLERTYGGASDRASRTCDVDTETGICGVGNQRLRSVLARIFEADAGHPDPESLLPSRRWDDAYVYVDYDSRLQQAIGGVIGLAARILIGISGAIWGAIGATTELATRGSLYRSLADNVDTVYASVAEFVGGHLFPIILVAVIWRAGRAIVRGNLARAARSIVGLVGIGALLYYMIGGAVGGFAGQPFSPRWLVDTSDDIIAAAEGTIQKAQEVITPVGSAALPDPEDGTVPRCSTIVASFRDAYDSVASGPGVPTVLALDSLWLSTHVPALVMAQYGKPLLAAPSWCWSMESTASPDNPGLTALIIDQAALDDGMPASAFTADGANWVPPAERDPLADGCQRLYGIPAGPLTTGAFGSDDGGAVDGREALREQVRNHMDRCGIGPHGYIFAYTRWDDGNYVRHLPTNMAICRWSTAEGTWVAGWDWAAVRDLGEGDNLVNDCTNFWAGGKMSFERSGRDTNYFQDFDERISAAAGAPIAGEFLLNFNGDNTGTIMPMFAGFTTAVSAAVMAWVLVPLSFGALIAQVALAVLLMLLPISVALVALGSGRRAGGSKKGGSDGESVVRSGSAQVGSKMLWMTVAYLLVRHLLGFLLIIVAAWLTVISALVHGLVGGLGGGGGSVFLNILSGAASPVVGLIILNHLVKGAGLPSLLNPVKSIRFATSVASRLGERLTVRTTGGAGPALLPSPGRLRDSYRSGRDRAGRAWRDAQGVLSRFRGGTGASDLPERTPLGPPAGAGAAEGRGGRRAGRGGRTQLMVASCHLEENAVRQTAAAALGISASEVGADLDRGEPGGSPAPGGNLPVLPGGSGGWRPTPTAGPGTAESLRARQRSLSLAAAGGATREEMRRRLTGTVTWLAVNDGAAGADDHQLEARALAAGAPRGDDPGWPHMASRGGPPLPTPPGRNPDGTFPKDQLLPRWAYQSGYAFLPQDILRRRPGETAAEHHTRLTTTMVAAGLIDPVTGRPTDWLAATHGINLADPAQWAQFRQWVATGDPRASINGVRLAAIHAEVPRDAYSAVVLPAAQQVHATLNNPVTTRIDPGTLAHQMRDLAGTFEATLARAADRMTSELSRTLATQRVLDREVLHQHVLGAVGDLRRHLTEDTERLRVLQAATVAEATRRLQAAGRELAPAERARLAAEVERVVLSRLGDPGDDRWEQLAGTIADALHRQAEAAGGQLDAARVQAQITSQLASYHAEALEWLIEVERSAPPDDPGDDGEGDPVEPPARLVRDLRRLRMRRLPGT